MADKGRLKGHNPAALTASICIQLGAKVPAEPVPISEFLFQLIKPLCSGDPPKRLEDCITEFAFKLPRHPYQATPLDLLVGAVIYVVRPQVG
jgi:hypothetical protein